METSKQLTHATSKKLTYDFEEKWQVIINTGGKYTLNGEQAKVLQEAIASGSRGIVVFRTFSISIPYITEFYRYEKIPKNKQLPSSTKEVRQIPPDEWRKLKQLFYKKMFSKKKGDDESNKT